MTCEEFTAYISSAVAFISKTAEQEKLEALGDLLTMLGAELTMIANCRARTEAAKQQQALKDNNKTTLAKSD